MLKFLKWYVFMIATVALAISSAPSAQTQRETLRYIPYKDARPIIEGLSEALSADLKSTPPETLAEIWNGWVKRRDADIRSRLIQGDEDSLVNFLLFGTSFTKQPRISDRQLMDFDKRTEASAAAQTNQFGQPDKTLNTRIDDLINGLLTPGNNERLAFARHFIVRLKGYDPALRAGREQIRKYLFLSLRRVLTEQISYQKTLEAARLQGDPTEEFAERSKLYRTRGLSLDTSLLPNFALEQALSAMKARGLFKPHSVRRVAIIGPGLDFTDKQQGYDVYPQQTIQPFAIIDSLLRLDLSSSDLAVTTFDLSPRVNEHIVRAKRRARQGLPYVLQLPRNLHGQWKVDAVRYWKQFGDQVGASTAPVAIPRQLADLELRAVRVRPAIVSKLTPVDLNVILQRLELPTSEQFDLMIATNILVYYDTFEQSLAVANIERMIRPGGFLLSNNVLLELPISRLRSVEYSTTVYSDRADDGDHIVWYQRTAD